MQRLFTVSAVLAGLLALSACSSGPSFGSGQQVSYTNGQSYGAIQLPYTVMPSADNAEAYVSPNWPGEQADAGSYTVQRAPGIPYNMTHGAMPQH